MQYSDNEFQEILIEATSRLMNNLRNAHKQSSLDAYLSKIEMLDLIPDRSNQFQTDPYGKILICGGTKTKASDIYGIAKNLGLEKNRIEVFLEYEKIKTFDFKNLQYNFDYRLILAGPMPHSGINKGGYSSILTNIERSDGYPKVRRLTDAHGLSITKTNLKKVLTEEIENRYVLLSDSNY